MHWSTDDQGTAESPCECQTKTDLVDGLFVGHREISCPYQLHEWFSDHRRDLRLNA
jgi:hypothetical protein